MGYHFKIGDTVKCIESISPEDGGPKKNEVFKITSIDVEGYIGFPLHRLNIGYNPKIKKGIETCWKYTCFALYKEFKIEKEEDYYTWLANRLK